MASARRALALPLAVRMTGKGLVPGAAFGGHLGLVPGLLLAFVAGGGSYQVGRGEIFSFLVMSIAAFALAGAILGGACAGIACSVAYAIRSRGLGR